MYAYFESKNYFRIVAMPMELIADKTKDIHEFPYKYWRRTLPYSTDAIDNNLNMVYIDRLEVQSRMPVTEDSPRERFHGRKVEHCSIDCNNYNYYEY